MTSDLLSMALSLSEATGRSCTDADRTRLAKKISALTQAEATVERSALKRMLDLVSETPTVAPNRNRP